MEDLEQTIQPTTKSAGELFLGTDDAARHIGRHRSSLDKWRAKNIVLPYYRHGKKIQYAVKDLDAYLQSLRVEPVAGPLGETWRSAP